MELAASRERAHLAQELHDSVTQALFAISTTAGTAKMMLERGRPGVETKLEELAALAREAQVEMRSLLFELRPGNVAEEGLVQALRHHANAVQARTGLVIHVRADPEVERLLPAQENALYRIAHEAIHNVVKHAHARTVDGAVGPPSYWPAVEAQSYRDALAAFKRDRGAADNLALAAKALVTRARQGEARWSAKEWEWRMVAAIVAWMDWDDEPGAASAPGVTPSAIR